MSRARAFLGDPESSRRMVEFQRAIGRKLRVARMARGWSLAAAAEAAGTSSARIGTYERGERRMSVCSLAALADVYGVPLAALLPGAPLVSVDAVERVLAALQGQVDRLEAALAASPTSGVSL